MSDVQRKIIDVMEKNSAKGKTMIYPTDLAKKVGIRFRGIQKEVKKLIDDRQLAYYHPGSTTYIMLKRDYDIKKQLEEIGL